MPNATILSVQFFLLETFLLAPIPLLNIIFLLFLDGATDLSGPTRDSPAVVRSYEACEPEAAAYAAQSAGVARRMGCPLISLAQPIRQSQ